MTSTLSNAPEGVIRETAAAYGFRDHTATNEVCDAVEAWRERAASVILEGGRSLGGSTEAIESLLREAGLIDPEPEPEPAVSGSLTREAEAELNALSRSYPALAAALRAKLSQG